MEREEKKKALSIVDVAQMAGVSVATVSRVINNSDKVSKKTRAKVMKVIKSVDYIPNEVARGLVTRSSSTIGVLISDIFNGYYAEIISFIEKYLSEKGYSLQLCIANQDGKKLEFYIDDLIRKRAAGIAILSFKIESEKLIRKMKNNTALLDHGIEIRDEYMIEEGQSSMAGYEAVLRLLRLSDPPTAIQCMNEFCARGVYMALMEKGIHIPNQISVAAFDGQQSSKLLLPRLMTAAIPIEMLAKEAVSMLLDNINNGNSEIARKVTLPTKLVLGDSVKRIS